MIGFETIGSATIIAYDDGPVLTTDAWINDDAYFGAWMHDYEIPAAQMEAIRGAKFHWFSHGHPDHLNIDSLPMLTKGQFLLSDHYGSRIRDDLIRAGHNVRILKDRVWEQLSPHVRVMSFPNQNQDSILLIDINGHLIVDVNDSPEYGAAHHIRRIAKNYKEVYLTMLHGWGGADMLNLFNPDGSRRVSIDAQRRPIAPRAQKACLQYGASKFIPFSSFHRFQREDAAWANALVPELDDYLAQPFPGGAEGLPAFVRVDCVTGDITRLNPRRNNLLLRKPEEFGDNWADAMIADDIPVIEGYFRRIEHLADHFGFVEVRLGGVSHQVRLNQALGETGITFEAPRSSFMFCIQHHIFDDLLIANYMKTTLHNVDSLYPDFSPYVAKYADNGQALTKADITTYFHHYAMRDPIGKIMTSFATGAEQLFRSVVPEQSRSFKAAKKLYYQVMRKS